MLRIGSSNREFSVLKNNTILVFVEDSFHVQYTHGHGLTIDRSRLEYWISTPSHVKSISRNWLVTVTGWNQQYHAVWIISRGAAQAGDNAETGVKFTVVWVLQFYRPSVQALFMVDWIGQGLGARVNLLTLVKSQAKDFVRYTVTDIHVPQSESSWWMESLVLNKGLQL